MERMQRAALGLLLLVPCAFFAGGRKYVWKLFTKQWRTKRFSIRTTLEPRGEPVASIAKQPSLYIEGNIEAQLKFPGVQLSSTEELNFALLGRAGSEELIAVRSSDYSKGYHIYEKPPLHALFKLTKRGAEQMRFFAESDSTPITFFLKHQLKMAGRNSQNKSVQIEDFFQFFLARYSAKPRRICRLDRESTEDILNLIKVNEVKINDQWAATLNSLFITWAEATHLSQRAEILELILELDPSVIDRVRGFTTESLLVKNALDGRMSETLVIQGAMHKQGVVLSVVEKWIEQIISDEESKFAFEGFETLHSKIKTKIFFAAHAWGRWEIVKGLKPLNIVESSLVWSGPGLFSKHTDIVTAHSKITIFLRELKQQKLLFTREEFEQLDSDQYHEIDDGIGSIQAGRFMAGIIAKHNIPEIKLAEQCLVIEDPDEKVAVYVDETLKLISYESRAYSKSVPTVERTISLQEAIGLMTLLIEAGYPFVKDAVSVAQNCIYLTGIQYDKFDSRSFDFDSLEEISDLVSREDYDALLYEFEKCKLIHHQNQSTQDSHPESSADPYTDLVKAYAEQSMFFSYNTL
jgi:hypothetical protein